jgi:hypothetical protein
MFSKVLLPQPEGPMMDTTSPRRTAKFTSRAASTSPALPGRPKRLSTPMNSMAIAGLAASFMWLSRSK